MVLATDALHLGWVCACSELTCALSFAIGVRSQGSFDAEVLGVSPSPASPRRGCLSVKHRSSSIIIDLGHEGLELLSSIHSHKTPLLSFTASLTANCISRRPNCTGTFQCHSNNEHAIPQDRSSDKLRRGSRSSGCLAVVVVLLFAHLGRWWCEEAPDGGDFLCFRSRVTSPRASRSPPRSARRVLLRCWPPVAAFPLR